MSEACIDHFGTVSGAYAMAVMASDASAAQLEAASRQPPAASPQPPSPRARPTGGGGVLRPGGVLAVWSYGIRHLVGTALVKNGYRDLVRPGATLPALAAAWGEAQTPRRLHWPLTIKASRLGSP